MQILENVSLSGYSTMRLGGPARFLTEISDRSEIAGLVSWANENQLPVIMIGEGSNIVWSDEGFPGLVMVNKIMGHEVQQQDDINLFVRIGAGENWDSVVERYTEMGYNGIAELSLIPGTTGATPVQNVGAYGREIREVLVTLEAFDSTQNKLVTLRGDECGFSYRMSRFKSTDRGRFFITSITLNLTKIPPQPPFYGAVEQYFIDHGVTTVTPQLLRDAVITIRTSKLPDPAQVANNGSFFANPIIDKDTLQKLQDQYPTLPYWQQDDNRVKISAAWLVEQAGFKGVHDERTGMATWDKQPLVLVNEGAQTTAQLIEFRDKIVAAVEAKFQITLVQEPELI